MNADMKLRRLGKRVGLTRGAVAWQLVFAVAFFVSAENLYVAVRLGRGWGWVLVHAAAVLLCGSSVVGFVRLFPTKRQREDMMNRAWVDTAARDPARIARLLAEGRITVNETRAARPPEAG